MSNELTKEECETLIHVISLNEPILIKAWGNGSEKAHELWVKLSSSRDKLIRQKHHYDK